MIVANNTFEYVKSTFRETEVTNGSNRQHLDFILKSKLKDNDPQVEITYVNLKQREGKIQIYPRDNVRIDTNLKKNLVSINDNSSLSRGT